MTTRISLNGNIFKDVGISVLDHGFLFGDSVYEVICTRKGRPCFIDRHLSRLRNSADAIMLKIPWTDERFKQEIQNTLDAAKNQESYLRIMVTRGEGEIDIDPLTCQHPNVLIYVKAAKVYPLEEYKKGIPLALVSVKRNAREALNPAIKTGNYLNNVLAKIEANRLGARDALMLNNEGQITESTTSNIFWVRDGFLRTPSLDCGILSGITREIVIQLAKENGILVEEGKWDFEELRNIDEAFLTGTIKKIMPVSHLNGEIVGPAKPGQLTLRIMGLYEAVLEKIE